MVTQRFLSWQADCKDSLANATARTGSFTWGEEKMIISVLLLFILSLFKSSVYLCMATLCCHTLSLSGSTYITNNREPNTDPWGTPNMSSASTDVASILVTVCVQL